MAESTSQKFIVLGAGVVGLTTALTLKQEFPNASVTIIAKFFPGDRTIEYTSPWAGANWFSVATDGGRTEEFERVTFLKFEEQLKQYPHCGLAKLPLKAVFDQEIQNAEVLNRKTEEIWYKDLVGGVRMLSPEELPAGSVFGFEVASTFVISVPIYLSCRWLQNQALSQGISLRRHEYKHIDDAFDDNADTTAVFNCTGLGSYKLGGVEDKKLYPTKGITLLVAEPKTPISKMYIRSPRRVDPHFTHIFPRPLGSGVIIGGCRIDNVWDDKIDEHIVEGIKERCCALCPELGDPKKLQVISTGVGLRPSRTGGPRIELENRAKGVTIHNYGIGGYGYQSSWGMASLALSIFKQSLKVVRRN